jgi:hypothetical protein
MFHVKHVYAHIDWPCKVFILVFYPTIHYLRLMMLEILLEKVNIPFLNDKRLDILAIIF